jgi:hypothetical protein
MERTQGRAVGAPEPAASPSVARVGWSNERNESFLPKVTTRTALCVPGLRLALDCPRAIHPVVTCTRIHPLAVRFRSRRVKRRRKIPTGIRGRNWPTRGGCPGVGHSDLDHAHPGSLKLAMRVCHGLVSAGVPDVR